jgi:bifunctional non-homologous end joining protein LigD
VSEHHRTPISLNYAALMHPRLHRAPFTRAGWIFEHKLDGFRALAWTGRAPTLPRNGLSYGIAFPEIIAALRPFRVAAVLDCELVVVDATGRPQWERLRRRARIYRPGAPQEAAASEPATLCAFDLLAVGRNDYRQLPLLQRKERLTEIVDGTPRVHYVEHLEALFAKVCELDLENIVAKQADSPYRAGRQPMWVKEESSVFAAGSTRLPRSLTPPIGRADIQASNGSLDPDQHLRKLCTNSEEDAEAGPYAAPLRILALYRPPRQVPT